MPLPNAAIKYKTNNRPVHTMLMRNAAFFIRILLIHAKPKDNKKAGIAIHKSVRAAISPLTSSFNKRLSVLPPNSIDTKTPNSVINAYSPSPNKKSLTSSIAFQFSTVFPPFYFICQADNPYLSSSTKSAGVPNSSPRPSQSPADVRK